MPDQDQNHDAHQGPLENDGPAYGREGRDSVYPAALKKTQDPAGGCDRCSRVYRDRVSLDGRLS
jgi:hypothetical protein